MGRKKTEDFSIKFYLLGGLSVDEWWEKLDVIKQEKIGLKLKTGGGGLKNFVKCLLKTVRGRSAASLPDMIIWVQADFMKITEPQTQWTFSHIIVWCATKSGTASRRSRQQQGQERFKARFFDTHVRYPSKTTRRKEKKKARKTYSDFCASSWNTHGVLSLLLQEYVSLLLPAGDLLSSSKSSHI